MMFALMAFFTQLASCQTGRQTARCTKSQKCKKLPKSPLLPNFIHDPLVLFNPHLSHE